MELTDLSVYEILGYGVIGLGFLLAFLAYLLLRKDRSKPGPVYVFMVFCVVLCGIGLYAQVRPHPPVPPAPIDPNSLAEKRTVALNRFVADNIEGTMRAANKPGAKGVDTEDSTAVDEFNYKLLRRAVFFNVLSFEASAPILKGGLETLRRRDVLKNSEHIGRVLSQLPDLLRIRLRWLEDEAIPALRRAIEEHGGKQDAVFAEVPLPEKVWLVDHTDNDVPTAPVRHMPRLEEEVHVLKNALAK